jgi:hypothetical protein
MNQTLEKKTPQEWANYLAAEIEALLAEGHGWVSNLPPDAAVKLQAAFDIYVARGLPR